MEIYQNISQKKSVLLILDNARYQYILHWDESGILDIALYIYSAMNTSVKKTDIQSAATVTKQLKENICGTDNEKLKASLAKVTQLLESDLFLALFDIQTYYDNMLRDSTDTTRYRTLQTGHTVIKGWPEITLNDSVDTAIKEMLDDAIMTVSLRKMEIERRSGKKSN